ncbi:hypothetical protein BSLA_03f0038 [Burkholderia stabilis]|nr:hypothetical protein BSLA_03f0038 [Burkholderia stabilis]
MAFLFSGCRERRGSRPYRCPIPDDIARPFRRRVIPGPISNTSSTRT